ncbi:hypothetical protein [Microlunatus flavus]|uniref:Uncharacterized protein n=1 Tax=Microlunatus flavus TaxID=1036181 RepID=A0A1H9JLM2_9ACTN|nr:hypothetical protein [Microlunatus flavus]SEQ87732.1 hypothetical protein SAMN05421756_106257 [Microlunatus flavus]
MSAVGPVSASGQRPGALRTAWSELPVLLLGSVPVAAAWAVLRSLPPGWGWLALLGVGLVVLPALAVLVRGCEVLLEGERVGVADLLLDLVRCWPTAARVTVVPTAAALLALIGLHVWRVSHQTWVLASVGACLAVTVATAVVAVVALPYVLRTGEPARRTWLVCSYVATRDLVPVLAVVSALGLGVWGAAHLSFALVLLLPAPLALVWACALATATRRSRARLASRSGPRPS